MPPILSHVRRHAPALLTFAVLAGLFAWGHHSGWRLSRPVAEAPHGVEDAWCPEHHVPEAVCMTCKKGLGREFAAREPAHQRAAGEEVRFAQLASPEALAKAGITVATAALASIAPRLRVAGETMYPPGSVARLGSRSDGIVREVLVQVGAEVQTGAVVAVLETAEVGRAKSVLMQMVTSRDLAHAQAMRARATAAAGIRSPADLEEFESRLRSAEVALIDAEQALRNLGLAADAGALAGLDAATLAARLRRLGLPEGLDDGGSANLLPLRAPRAGTVTAIQAVVGEAVEANAPIVVVADTALLWAALPVSPERAAQVAVGQPVTFATDSGQAAGTVVAIAQAADPQTRLVTVWAQLANAGHGLRVGLFGTAIITTGAAVPAALLPAGAVQFDGDQAYVFVRRTDTVFRGLPVRILAREADGRIAVDRLAEGDVVATTGTATLFAICFRERMGAGCCGD